MKTKMRYRIFLIALLLCLAGFAAGCTQQPASQDQTSQGQESVQTTATVELDGNPTTGYNWTCDITPDGVVSETSNGYVQNDNPDGKVGVGGKFQFDFVSVAPGEAELTFSYLRPWEDGVPAINTVVYKATVDDSLGLKLELVDSGNSDSNSGVSGSDSTGSDSAGSDNSNSTN